MKFISPILKMKPNPKKIPMETPIIENKAFFKLMFFMTHIQDNSTFEPKNY